MRVESMFLLILTLVLTCLQILFPQIGVIMLVWILGQVVVVVPLVLLLSWPYPLNWTKAKLSELGVVITRRPRLKTFLRNTKKSKKD